MKELTLEQMADDFINSHENTFEDIIHPLLAHIMPIGMPMMKGGKGMRPNRYEQTFKKLYPYLESQVSFGTGKGGLKKYGSKCYTVDFLDRENNIAVEIDGSSHNTLKRKLRDVNKELFLLEEHGIRTVRFTNEQVREKLIKRFEKLEKEGRLEEQCRLMYQQ